MWNGSHEGVKRKQECYYWITNTSLFLLDTIDFPTWIKGIQYDPSTSVTSYTVGNFSSENNNTARVKVVCNPRATDASRVMCPQFFSVVGYSDNQEVRLDLVTRASCPQGVPYCSLDNGVDLSGIPSVTCSNVIELYNGVPSGTFDFTFDWCQGPAYITMSMAGGGGPVLRTFTQWVSGLSYNNATQTAQYEVSDGNLTSIVSLICAKLPSPPGKVTCPASFQALGGAGSAPIFLFSFGASNACT